MPYAFVILSKSVSPAPKDIDKNGGKLNWQASRNQVFSTYMTGVENDQLSKEAIDVTLPLRSDVGSYHPVSLIAHEISIYFKNKGYLKDMSI